MQMALQLVNSSVYCNARSKTLLPWTIMKVSEPDFTFRMFFTQEVMLRIQEQDGLQLQSAHAGPNKETLDHVDLDLCSSCCSKLWPFREVSDSIVIRV